MNLDELDAAHHAKDERKRALADLEAIKRKMVISVALGDHTEDQQPWEFASNKRSGTREIPSDLRARLLVAMIGWCESRINTAELCLKALGVEVGP